VLYRTYEVHRATVERVVRALDASIEGLGRAPRPVGTSYPVRAASAASQVSRALRLTHERPEFGVGSVASQGVQVEVLEDVVASTPFASLVRFVKADGSSDGQPKVLVVPGLAGHFATLVRATISTMLADHDVYVADWHNARDVPVSAVNRIGNSRGFVQLFPKSSLERSMVPQKLAVEAQIRR